MSTKNSPGAFRCYEAALPDEHLFTILARDPAGPATLRFWAEERERVGKTQNPDDVDRIADARRDASLMEAWREKNLDPMGDGSGPSWKLVKITDDDGGPIRATKDNTVYLPAERDGTEAVRLNVEWLTARTRDLVEGKLSRPDFAELISLACQSPDRRRDFMRVEEAEDSLLYRLEGAIHNLRDGRLPAPYDLYRAVHKQVQIEGESPWTYEVVGIGLSDLETALDRLRTSPVAVDRPTPSVAETKPVSRDVTEIDEPEMPPHRFAMFDKGKGWAYGRGLEINPSHIPAMLDRMEADGYVLVAALGAQADKVGMIFQRGARYTAFELAHGFGGGFESREDRERRREGPQYQRFMGGEPLDEIRADDNPDGGACGMGRGQEP